MIRLAIFEYFVYGYIVNKALFQCYLDKLRGYH